MSIRQPVETAAYKFLVTTAHRDLEFEITQEFDGHGCHRLRYDGGPLDQHIVSDWANYRSFAKMYVYNKGCFIGTSDFYHGELPPVFQVFPAWRWQ